MAIDYQEKIGVRQRILSQLITSCEAAAEQSDASHEQMKTFLPPGDSSSFAYAAEAHREAAEALRKLL